MGRVFLGQSPGGHYVAVKVIRAELAGLADFRTRFAREVATARRVSSLFTAPVVDADLDAPVPWLATAYVAGPSLDDAVARHGPLPASSVPALAAGLAEGLGAIHAAGIVHRDLKPSNVLLAEDGPRVIDFGISRAVEQFTLTSTGLVVGSPGFMSPEQAQGHPVGPPSDVFSLGAVLVFAAAGEGPFGSGSTAALLYRVVFDPPATDAVPARLRPLVERCLAKDPQQRPGAGDLLSDLNAQPTALNAQPTAGWLPAPSTRGRPAHPPTVANMADAPSARPVPGSIGSPSGPESPGSPGSPGPDGGRGRLSRKAIIAILAVAALVLSGIAAALTLTHRSSSANVALESVGTPGVNPFMPAVGTDQPEGKPLKGTGGAFPGGTPGLYGGTRKRASCNPRQLVGYLRVHPDKAAAWAGVFGIQPTGIPSYVADLTPVVLRSDTAVTNHGYIGGHVTSFPAILEAGTAVLIDRHGQPVTKCFCGNPLTRPMAYTQPTYVGQRWASFSPASVTTITPSIVVNRSFILVDPTTGSTFRRPSGTSVPASSAPATGTPATTAPATGTPATTAPATGTPATTAPATGTPATSVPAASVPAASAPATGTPATTAPATGTPATTAPATGAPAASVPAASVPAASAPAASAPAASVPAASVPAASAPAASAPAASAPAASAPAASAPAASAPAASAPEPTAPGAGSP